MDTPSPSIRDLARRLLEASRTVSSSASNPGEPEPPRVIERLRIVLSRLTGADGFTVLLVRALARASVEIPSLAIVKVTADGRLEGLEQMAGDASDRGKAVSDASIAITTHLLDLLVVFIGEPLTLALVSDAFPGKLLDE
jgi:hypothetical protein